MSNNNDDDFDDLDDDQPRPSIEEEGVTTINSEENSSSVRPPPEERNDVYVQTSAYLVEEVDDNNNKNIEIAKAEQVRPFFQRKEGQLTVIIVGLLVASVVILLGVFLTRDEGGSSSGSDVLAATLPSDAPTLPPTFDPRPTLAIVQDRGVVNCGIDDLEEGNVNLNVFNIDQCRAVAATVFGNPTKINLVVVSDKNRFVKLERREVDVLFAGTPFTLENLIREV